MADGEFHDPFGRSQLPPDFSRAGRIALVAEAARLMLDDGRPAMRFVGGALMSWLQAGGRLGSLERDFLKIAAPGRSTATPSRVWQSMTSDVRATDTNDSVTLESSSTEGEE